MLELMLLVALAVVVEGEEGDLTRRMLSKRPWE